MEGRGRSRRHSPQREWKRRLSSVLAVVLTVVMVLNMPLSIDGLGLRISNAFASGNGTGQDSVWATASNAKYKQGDSKDVDIYVIAEDNEVVPGNTSSMTLYLKNNTDQEITEGVLTFKGRYINKEDVTFQDIGAGEIFDTVIAGGGPGTPNQDTAESAEDSAADAAAFPEASGEGLLYQEVQGTEADGNDAALMDDDNDAAPMDDDNDAEPAGDDFDAENGDVEENDEDEEEPWKLEEIDLQPGELHEIHFEFYTEEDIKSTKANVTFSFRGENEEGSRVESSTKFYYSIGLPTVNFSMEDGMQIESGVSNDLEIWMSEPDWVDEDLEEKLLEQEEKKEEEEMKDDEEDAAGGTESGIEPGTASDSEASKDASKASNSNASKNETASDSNADKDNSNTVSQEDEEKIDKYTQEAMEISESRVNYTVEIFGAKVDLHARKTVEAEDIGWISCVYEVDTNTEPGIYYGKVTASGKWNKKDFTSEQGFLFEVTGEAVREYVEETDNVIVRANAEASVLPKDVKLVVKELREDDSDTADQYLEAKEALDTEGTAYEGMMALDISFVNEDGEEIEPDGEVQVSIELKKDTLPEDVDLETVEIHHLKEIDENTIELEAVADRADKTDGTVKTAEETAAELKEAEVSEKEIKASVSEDAAAVAAFSVESFSTFTITWGTSNSNRRIVSVRAYANSYWNELPDNAKPTNVTLSVGETIELDANNEDLQIEGYSLAYGVLADTRWNDALSGTHIVKLRLTKGNGNAWNYTYTTAAGATGTLTGTYYLKLFYDKAVTGPDNLINFYYTGYSNINGAGSISDVKDSSYLRYTITLLLDDGKEVYIDEYVEGLSDDEKAEILYPEDYCFNAKHIETTSAIINQMGIHIPGFAYDNAYFYWSGYFASDKTAVTDLLNYGGLADNGNSRYDSFIAYSGQHVNANGTIDPDSKGQDYKDAPNYWAYNPTGTLRLVFKKVSDTVKYESHFVDAYDRSYAYTYARIDMDMGWDSQKAQYYGTLAGIPSESPTKDGYTFAGWYDAKDETGNGTGKKVSKPSDDTKQYTEDAYYYARWEPAQHEFTVTKKISGNMADPTESFGFMITVTNNNEPVAISKKENSTIAVDDDGTFWLKDGESVTFTGIPNGAKVTVKETNSKGYDVFYKINDAGDPVKGSDYTINSMNGSYSSVTFINQKSVEIPTGLPTNNYPYLLMLAFAAVGATSFIYPTCRRRRQKGDK